MSNATASPLVWTATVDDLSMVEGKAELVDGRLVEMSPAGGVHGYVVLEIAIRLRSHAHAHGGRAFGDNIGFIVDLPHRRSFSPDAAYFEGEVGDGFLQGAPVFAVEVRSPEDFGPRAEEALARKRADYFAAGTLVVWDVDPLRERVVRAYRAAAPDSPGVFREGDEADAEPAVPGWRVRVQRLCRLKCPRRTDAAHTCTVVQLSRWRRRLVACRLLRGRSHILSSPAGTPPPRAATFSPGSRRRDE